MKEQGWTNGNGKAMNTSQLDRFLDNPFYHGMMQVKGKLYPHKYPLLISESLFNQVQRIKHRANKSNARHAGKKDILLRGLMTCNCCGCRITGDIKKSKYVYYSCTNGKGTCKKEWVREEEITSLMGAHVDADKTSLITVKTVLDLAKRAKEIYESSKVDEKRQILNFVFSNLEMKDKKAIITLHEPFDKLVAVSDHPKCRRRWDSNPRYGISVHTLSKRAP